MAGVQQEHNKKKNRERLAPRRRVICFYFLYCLNFFGAFQLVDLFYFLFCYVGWFLYFASLFYLLFCFLLFLFLS